jgi:hypothetical protein
MAREDMKQIDDALGVGHDVRGVVVLFLHEREAVGTGPESPPDGRLGLSTAKKHRSALLP